jgi:hypothetical protein
MQKSFVFVIRVYWRQPKAQSLLSFFLKKKKNSWRQPKARSLFLKKKKKKKLKAGGS